MKKLRITVGDKSYDVTVEELHEPSTTHAVTQARPNSGATLNPPPETPAPAPAAKATEPGAVLSPMAGVIKAVEVQPGDRVQAGQVLMLLEAMKLENRITAPNAGAVKTVHVAVGDSVGEGQLLLELE